MDANEEHVGLHVRFREICLISEHLNPCETVATNFSYLNTCYVTFCAKSKRPVEILQNKNLPGTTKSRHTHEY